MAAMPWQLFRLRDGSPFTNNHDIARRRRTFVESLNGTNAVTVRGSEGGMYVMVDVRNLAESGEEFAWDLLAAERMAVLPGESFGKAAAGHVRISMCETDERLTEAARRFRRFIASRSSR